MQLTRAQRRKLAKAARELAMEVVAGTAPQFGRYVEWYGDGSPCCANGHVQSRAGIPSVTTPGAESALNSVARADWWLVATASDASDERRDALPWALLSLADELEAQR